MKYISLFASFFSASLAFSLPSFGKRQANSAIASTAYRRRAYHSTAVLDGWLYIDGGEFSYASGTDIIYQYSSTLLSIDLSQDFTNATVNLRSNSKPAGVPDLQFGGIWVDEANHLLYTGFAGRPSSFGDRAYSDYGLWSFSPDGQGGGSWSNLNSSADPGFTTQERAFAPLVASGNGAGYMLGGFAVNTSSPDVRNGAWNISGLIRYDFASNTLSNSTVTGIANGGVIQAGGAHFVPNFGPQGIMVTFGGNQRGRRGGSSDALVDSTTVQIFDPATGSWYEQSTSGNVPEPRKEFCMTGAASNNNTYEIVVYAGWGGNLGPAAIPFDEVYVLSLPSFNWFKADYLAENPRHGVTCEHLGGGQILVVGGVNTTQNGPNNLYRDVFQPSDQFVQGLGLFDLNTMNWASGYSSQQTTYAQAASIQQYYASNSREPTYSSNGLQQLMAVQNFTPITTEPPNSGLTPPESPESPGSSTNVGAIAGGVVGGVAGLALIAGAAFLLIRRRRKNQGSGTDEVPHEMAGYGNQKHEMADTSDSNTATANNVRYAKYAPVPSAPQFEMPANERRHELA